MTESYFPPIPSRDNTLDARDYHSVKIDTLDPRGAEPLVDISKHGITVLPYYNISNGSNPPYGQRIDGSLPRLWCRKGILSMLLSANKSLEEFGCELVVYDAYRPIATQWGLWTWALERIKKDNPDLPRAELEALTSQYSSDPRRFNPEDPTTWPVHSSGASIDVMLRTLDGGYELDMGTTFDELSPLAHTDQLEHALHSGLIDMDNSALKNRRLLYWTMTKAGFENYPSEYWHFDFGNQMYVLNARAKNTMVEKAWYGYCEPPV